jgi:hypothetical protein
MTTELATAVGAAIGSAVVLAIAIGGLTRRLRPIVHTLDDLVGEDARPGVPRRPGIVERMTTNEDLVFAAAQDSSAAKKAAFRVENLLVRHMENTLTLQEAYLHNETQLHDALGAHGITVQDRMTYPLIETGDEPPHNRRDTDD